MKRLISLFILLILTICLLTSCASGEEKNTLGKDGQTYKYSEYIERETMEDELIEWFEKYDIRYYDSSKVSEFSNMDLPMPETVVVGFTSCEKMEDVYKYKFESEEELRVYLSAYVVYLMNQDYEIDDLDNNIYAIDDKYYIGMYEEDGDYCFLLMEP